MPLDGGPLMIPAKIAMDYGKEQEGKTDSKPADKVGGGMDCDGMQAVAEQNKAAIRAAGGRI